MLAHLFPRARWLWYALAAGCALTRVLARAHFVSDVTLSAVIGWAVAAVVWRWYLRRERRASATVASRSG
jgi:membrane-associated phospholipid phosphatase